MKTASRYYNLVKLDSSGKLKIKEIGLAKQFFIKQFSHLENNISDIVVQKDLVTLKNSQNENRIVAERCLRCFISHLDQTGLYSIRYAVW